MNSSKPPAKYSGVNLAQLSSSSSPLVVHGREEKWKNRVAKLLSNIEYTFLGTPGAFEIKLKTG